MKVTITNYYTQTEETVFNGTYVECRYYIERITTSKDYVHDFYITYGIRD